MIIAPKPTSPQDGGPLRPVVVALVTVDAAGVERRWDLSDLIPTTPTEGTDGTL